jgi:adenylate kinase
MTPQIFIFIGRSGCGKGTQAKLLQDYLKKCEPGRDILYIQTGQELREFIKGTSVTQKVSKDLYDVGGLQPEFLMVYMWTNVLVNRYSTGEHLIMDGMPRKYHEAGVLDSVWKFYGIKNKPIVVYLNIPMDESVKRLMARKRMDDNEEDIRARLAWFETEVIPTLDFFKNNPDYTYMNIDGMPPAEQVHQEILRRAKLA